MARKVITHIVKNSNRDAGKIFVITEMSADDAQRWALRAFLALAKNGVQIPDGLENMGIVGMLQYGIEIVAQLPYEEANYLCERLLQCVQLQPGPNSSVTRALIAGDIEELTTRFILIKEAFKLHVDFTQLANASTQELGG